MGRLRVGGGIDREPTVDLEVSPSSYSESTDLQSSDFAPSPSYSSCLPSLPLPLGDPYTLMRMDARGASVAR